jgi:acyl carrier protein
MHIPDNPQSQSNTSRSRTTSQVQEWLIDSIAKEMQIKRDSILIDQPILSTGIDSIKIVSLMANLEDWGGFRFPGNPLEDYPTIPTLSAYVASLTQQK